MQLWLKITSLLLYFSIYSYSQSDSLSFFAEAGLNKLDCYDDETDITLTAWSGVAPYFVFWENSTRGDTGSLIIQTEGFFEAITPAKGGVYHFELTDSNGQSTESSIQIAEPAPIEFSLEATAASCTDSQDGVLRIFNISGGTVEEDYQITWLTVPIQNDFVINNLSPNLYTVVVTDDRACTAADTIRLDAAPALEIQANLVTPTCAEKADGSINVEILGGHSPYYLEWSNNAQTANILKAENLKHDQYYLTVTDASGLCSITDSFTLVAPLALSTQYDITTPNCQTATGSITVDSVQNAIYPVFYAINNLGFHSKNTFERIEPGLHTLYIRDANACQDSIVFQMPEATTLEVDLGKDIFITLGDSVQLSSKFEYTYNTIFTWLPETGLSCNDCPKPIAQPNETITYSLFLKDSTACEAFDEITIWVQKNRNIFIPNAFSPDGDGHNDVFVIFADEGVSFLHSIQIYNRWGALVFEKMGELAFNLPINGWDGKFQGQAAETGMYFYHIGVQLLDGAVLWYRGEVQLIR